MRETWQLRAHFVVAADIAGVTTTHIIHPTPCLLDIDELYRQMVDRVITMTEISAGADRTRVWSASFPSSHKELAVPGLAYYHGGDPAKPVVYEDFLPASAVGIFQSDLDSDGLDSDGSAVEDVGRSDYSISRMAGSIGHHIHDPYELYEKVAAS
jgi:uncharacterized glyoxalase superfamily metalloenzyme YdcJ